VPLDDLTTMTLRGCIPGAAVPSADPAEVPEPVPFETYVLGGSVLLGPHEAPSPPRIPPSWRPWLRHRMLRRACPVCVQDAGTMVFTVVSLIPLTLSCPQHAVYLETAPKAGPGEPPRLTSDARPAPEPVAAMDRITHHALGNPTVTVHASSPTMAAGTWLRLLRVVLHELTVPTWELPWESRQIVNDVWRLGAVSRPRTIRQVTFEQLGWPTQSAALHVAATALTSAAAGRCQVRGSMAALLRPAGRDPDPSRYLVRSHSFQELFDQAVEDARQSPEQAVTMLHWTTGPAVTEEEFTVRRGHLVALGIPARFLPGWHEWSPRTNRTDT